MGESNVPRNRPSPSLVGTARYSPEGIDPRRRRLPDARGEGDNGAICRGRDDAAPLPPRRRRRRLTQIRTRSLHHGK